MKNEIQKAKHKLDGDLRCSQEAALELERSKSEVQQAIQRKDKEFAAMQAKIEDEQGLGSKLQKQVKELGVSFLKDYGSHPTWLPAFYLKCIKKSIYMPSKRFKYTRIRYQTSCITLFDAKLV